MPEIFTSIPLDCSEIVLKVWKIEEPIDFFKTIPCEWYETIIKIKKSEIQQSESIAARFCLHEICNKQLLENVELSFDENGAPIFLNSSLNISLTHSYPFVAAIVSKKNQVGIDIEKKGRNIQKIAPRFLNSREFEKWNTNDHQLTLAWSIKESIYKASKIKGLSFQNEINLSEENGNPFRARVKEQWINVYWEIFDEFVLSVAKNESKEYTIVKNN